MPEVSVVIAAYNAERSIARAAQSALNQRDVDVEVIVVDDSSTDATRAICEQLVNTYPALRVISLPRNSGPSVARNTGIASSRGRWISILDADDSYEPTRLSKLVLFAEERDLDIVTDALIVISAEAEEKKTVDPYPGHRDLSAVTVKQFLLADMPGRLSFGAGYLKPVFRRDTLRGLGLRYEASVRVAEDALMIFNCLTMGARVGHYRRGLYNYYRGQPSITTSGHSGTIYERLEVCRLMSLMVESRNAEPGVQALVRRREVFTVCSSQYGRFISSLKARRMGAVLQNIPRSSMQSACYLRFLVAALMSRWRQPR